MFRQLLFAAVVLLGSITADDDKPPRRVTAMGNLAVVYNISSIISSHSHPLRANVSRIWCQGKKEDDILPVLSARFYHFQEKEFHEPSEINESEGKAYLQPSRTIKEGAGKYRCEIETEEGTAHGNLFAYVRPFFHSDGSLSLTRDDKNPLLARADPVTATEGSLFFLECPFFAYPSPTEPVVWYKDNEKLEIGDKYNMADSVLQIRDIQKSDDGMYRCTVSNEFPVHLDDEPTRFEATLERKVYVGTEYAWVYPLLVIIVILLLLFIIIYACAACKRYQHDQYNVQKRERLLAKHEVPSSSSRASSAQPDKLDRSALP